MMVVMFEDKDNGFLMMPGDIWWKCFEMRGVKVWIKPNIVVDIDVFFCLYLFWVINIHNWVMHVWGITLTWYVFCDSQPPKDKQCAELFRPILRYTIRISQTEEQFKGEVHNSNPIHSLSNSVNCSSGSSNCPFRFCAKKNLWFGTQSLFCKRETNGILSHKLSQPI